MKDIRLGLITVAVLMAGLAGAGTLFSQSADVAAGPPPSTGGIFPLSEVHRGLMATAWTVFTGTKPEPMQVEILGVLKGARGPGHDMILAQLHGTKPEYTGVVAGMSGSPVYIGDKLLGSLSYRIGQFSKDPIAGITPIAQMLEVRDIPVGDQTLLAALPRKKDPGPMGEEPAFVPMETPLVMSGFHPEAVRLWQQKDGRHGTRNGLRWWRRELEDRQTFFGRGGEYRSGVGGERSACRGRSGDRCDMHRYLCRSQAASGMRASDPAGGAGVAADDFE